LHIGEMRNAYSISVEKSDYKRPHGRCRRRWYINIEVSPKKRQDVVMLTGLKGLEIVINYQ